MMPHETGRTATAAVFYPAPPRKYIRPEEYYGFDATSLEKWNSAPYDLSGAPLFDAALPNLDPVPLDKAADKLTDMWRYLVQSRSAQEGDVHLSQYDDVNYAWEPLPFIAFAKTTDDLFKKLMVPAVIRNCRELGKKSLAVDTLSYGLPSLSQEELAKEGVDIVEGELASLITEGGELPDHIGAVYLDFPSNLQKVENAYGFDQLITFVRKHPTVLFIIDQANLYFLDWNNKNDLLKLPSTTSGDLRLTDQERVFVTTTTSKALGNTGCAAASRHFTCQGTCCASKGIQTARCNRF